MDVVREQDLSVGFEYLVARVEFLPRAYNIFNMTA